MNRLFRTPIPLLLLALGFAACNANPEKSPGFIKLRNTVTRMSEKQDKIEDDINKVYIQIGDLQEEILAIRKQGGAPGAPGADLTPTLARIETLEQQVANLQTALQVQGRMPAEAVPAQPEEGAQAEPSEPGPETANREMEAPGPARSRPGSEAAAASAQPTPSPAPQKTPAPQKPKGFYYKVLPGETLQAVASKHDVSVAQLCRDNRLQPSARLVPGQQIYVQK